jgi:Leucine-rich repeat (LRR) protein
MFFQSEKSRYKDLLRWAKNHKIELPSKPEELELLQKLDFKLKGVSKIPKEIDILVNLEEINAEFNEISELPWEFAHLKKLKVINFGHNRLIDIPGVICQITNLEILNLESNSIKKISPVIANLENLTYLNISFNQISELPQEIGHLKHLVQFNVAANSISQLPSSMHRLYNLAELHLWKNEIKEIPDFIKELPNLKIIELEADAGKMNQQLVIAVVNNDLNKAEKLLALGADINHKWLNYGNLPFTSPLFEARTVEMIQFLLDHGADPNVKREILKTSSIKVWESDKASSEFETFYTKKHPPEVAKFVKTLFQQK